MRKHIVIVALLALAACGSDGIEQSAPAEAPEPSVAASVASTRDEDIRHFLLQEYPDAGEISYALAWHDLNGDGTDEAIVQLIGSWFCGTGGCNTLVLTPAGPMWNKVGEISVSRTPITVLDSETNGWSDLTVAIGGGGGAAGTALLKFDGTSYPGNPTVPPAELTDQTGTLLLVEEPELLKATPEPAE